MHIKIWNIKKGENRFEILQDGRLQTLSTRWLEF